MAFFELFGDAALPIDDGPKDIKQKGLCTLKCSCLLHDCLVLLAMLGLDVDGGSDGADESLRRSDMTRQ